MWLKQYQKPSPVITIFIGGMEIPFPVMGGKDDIVLPT